MSRTTHKVVLSATVAAVALGAAGTGTYAAWSTSKTTSDKSVTAGTFGLTLTDSDVAVVDVAPGDTIQRDWTLTNPSSIAYSGISATFTKVVDSALLDSTAKSLQFSLRACSAPFATAATQPVAEVKDADGKVTTAARPAYAAGDCTGTTLGSVSSTSYPAFVTAAQALDFGALVKDAATHVRLNAVFPATTGDAQDTAAAASDYATYGGKNAAFNVKFTATQRTGVAK